MSPYSRQRHHLNLYGYVGQDPLNATDPSGTDAWENLWEDIANFFNSAFSALFGTGDNSYSNGSNIVYTPPTFAIGSDGVFEGSCNSGCKGSQDQDAGGAISFTPGFGYLPPQIDYPTQDQLAQSQLKRDLSLQNSYLAIPIIAPVFAPIIVEAGVAAAVGNAAAEVAGGATVDAAATGEYTLTQTVTNNMATRPYLNSSLTVQEIQATGLGVPDPGGIPGALRYSVPGNFSGRAGTYELVVHPEDRVIYHFLFKGGP